jgi:hypothetical protein
MSNKKESKLTPEEETEQEFLAKKATEPYEAKKSKAATAEGDIQPREGEEFLPPHDPPVVDSPPFPPPTGYEVSNQQKGAQPEVEVVVRELDLVTHGTRGEGPAPEPPEEPEVPPEEGKAKKEKS